MEETRTEAAKKQLDELFRADEGTETKQNRLLSPALRELCDQRVSAVAQNAVEKSLPELAKRVYKEAAGDDERAEQLDLLRESPARTVARIWDQIRPEDRELEPEFIEE